MCRQILIFTTLAVIMTLALACHKNAQSALHMNLTTTPDHPRMSQPITLQLHITDAQGQPVSDAQVNGTLTMKLMDMGTTQLKFSPKSNGDYEASLKGVDMSGPWNLAVSAAQGSTKTQQNFDVNIFD